MFIVSFDINSTPLEYEPTDTRKEKQLTTCEEIKRRRNIDRILARRRMYREFYLTYKREYYKNNKEKYKEYRLQYYQDNKEYLREYSKKYYEKYYKKSLL